ncbi:hypothetical protein ABPG74_013449 [Tetrahymena malaccensis]
MNSIKKRAQQFNSMLSKFYIEIFSVAIKSFDRNFTLSFVLIIVRQLQEISITFVNDGTPMNNLQSDQFNYFTQFIQCSSFYRCLSLLFDVNSAQIICLSFTFTLNLLIAISCLVLLLCSSLIQYDNKRIKKAGFILSIILSLYNYIFLLPSLETSTILLYQEKSQTIHILSYLNFSLTWIIAFVVAIHDYDYSFEGKDQLSKAFTRVEILAEVIAAIYLHIQFSCFQLLLSVVALLSLLDTMNSFALLGLAVIPVSFKLGFQIKKAVEQKVYQNNICCEDLSHLSPHEFDIFIRLICQNQNYFYEDYMEHKQGVFFESIYINHIIQCSKNNTQLLCFCSRFTSSQQSNHTQGKSMEDILGQDFRKQFVLYYVLNLYNKYLNGVDLYHKKYIVFSYLSFLTEKIKNVTKSFQELLKMQQEYTKNQDWTNLFFVKILIDRSSKFYNQFSDNSTIENQQIRMHDPITFDFLMVELQNSLKTQIQKQIEYLKYLCSDYFNLEELMIVSRINLNGIQNIRIILKELYDIHPKDQALNNLSQVFQLTLDFYSVSPKKLKQMSQKKQFKHFFLSQVDVFSPNSCSIYCSLIGKNIEVKRTSSNFQQIFELEQINVLGKHVSNLLPKILFQLHEATMDDFINLGIVESINIGQRFAFAQNGDGFIFPINIRIKIENFVDDFGVTALINKIEETKQYIFFDESFQISDISSYIYEKVFQSEYTLNQLRSQNIFNFIPLLQALLNDKSLSEINYYNTCLLLKRRQGTRFEIRSFNDRKLSVSSNEQIFSLIFKIKNLQSQHMRHIRYLEIEKFQEERSFLGRKYQLNLLSKCLNMEIQSQDNSQKENQDVNQESQINMSIQEEIQQQTKVLTASNNQDQINSLKVDDESQSQLNLFYQFSNNNIFGVKNNNEEITDIKREITSETYLKEHQNFASANRLNIQDQQIELYSPKYDTNSYQQLFNQSNRIVSPQSNFNLTTINSPISPSHEKSFEQQYFKGKNLQRSSQQLLQKQVLIRQSIQNQQENSQNQENFSLKHAICDINQMFLDKWSDSPSSANLHNKSQKNKNFENIKEEDEFSFENEKYIKRQFQSEESSDSSINGQQKDNKLNDEQQSAFTGSQGPQTSSKKILIRKITQNTNTGITNIIVFTGLASIIFLYISVLSFYFINISNLNQITNLFRKFNFATIINQGVFQFAKEQVFLADAITFQNILGLNNTFPNPLNSSQTITQLAYLQNVSQVYQKAYTEQFSNNINQILQSQNEEFFQYISETEISTFSDYYDNTIYTHIYRNNTILYTMLWFQSCLNQLYLQGAHEEYYPQSVVYGNIQVFNTAILQIQVMISDQLVYLYQQLKNTQLDQLIQTICSALFLIVIAVPFMIYFKSQQYKTIKLLGSFPPELLEQYINLLSYYLNRIEQYQKKQIEHISQYQSFNMIQSMRTISGKQLSGVFDAQKVKQENKDTNLMSKKFIQKKQYGKKVKNTTKRQRQIASFSQSKPFKFKYILVSLLVVVPFMVYPIFNLISVDLFVDESLTTLTQRQAILSCSSFILNFEVVHFKIWQIVFTQPTFNKIFFYLYGQNVTQQAQVVMDGIKNLTNYETNSRYDYSQRQIYFSSLLLDSICDYIDNIENKKIDNSYLQTNFTAAQCHGFLSGNLDRGFILAIQDLTNLYQDWFSTYQQFSAIQTPGQTYQQNITQTVINIQHTKNNLIDIYYSNILLQELVVSFEDFFENQNNKYTNYIIQMFTILITLQMILIFFAISIVWTSLYQKFKQEISKTKLLLTNLHIDLILENKLTLLHFKNQSY